jgi:ComEC/Rec2-related protein
VLHLDELSAILRSGLAALVGRLLAEAAGMPAFALLFALFAMLMLQLRSGRLQAQRSWAPLLLAATLGAASSTEPPRLGRHRGAVPEGLVDFAGIVTQPLRREAHGRRALELRIAGQTIQLSLQGYARFQEPELGDHVEGRAAIRYDTRGQPRLLTHPGLLRVRPRASPLARLRSGIIASLRASWRSALPRGREALVALLVLGQREDFDPELRRSHQNLGLAHLLAISGLHTVFVAGLLLLLLRVLRVRPPLWPWLGGLLLVYAWLSGFRPPVVRAGLAATMWLAARERGMQFGIGGALSLGLWTTLVLWPEEFGSVSFCLSYVAVASLAAIPPLFARWRPRGNGIARWSYDSLVVSCAAQIGTATLGLVYFGILALHGALLTPLLVPLVFGILALGLVAPLLALLLPMLAMPLLELLDALVRVYVAFVESLASLPGAPIFAATMQYRDVALVLLLVGFGLALLLRSRAIWLLACLGSILPFYLPSWPKEPRPRFELLAVGHGLSALYTGLEGNLLFDCGDSWGGRLAARRVRSALERSGRNRIDTLVISHGDSDHYSALATLLSRHAVGKIIVPECHELGPVIRLARKRRIPVQIVPSGGTLLLDERAALHLPLAEGDLEGGNHSALALELCLTSGRGSSSGGVRILVCGDQEEAASRALANWARPPELLVLPHHGELHSGLVDLLRRLQPDELWASAGVGSELVEAWRAGGFGVGRAGGLGAPRPWLTGLEGELRLLPDAHRGLRIESERGRVLRGSEEH